MHWLVCMPKPPIDIIIVDTMASNKIPSNAASTPYHILTDNIDGCLTGRYCGSFGLHLRILTKPAAPVGL